jgi:hypothetical protein
MLSTVGTAQPAAAPDAAERGGFEASWQAKLVVQAGLVLRPAAQVSRGPLGGARSYQHVDGIG